ncbi:diguanylate cyclase domain-containing protein [Pelomonas baiyunensis]|uniref:Diguanylate cyclase domain-containing protein n=1 Tax=Pelomonas baiyunensis TaxID=3299026 RepID=A0ABW7H1S8_9BURK
MTEHRTPPGGALPPLALLARSHELWWQEDAHGHLLQVSPSAQHLCGWPADALRGAPVRQLLDDAARQALHVASAHGLGTCRAALLGLDQPPRAVELTAQPLFDAQGQPDGRWVLARDLTEQVQLESRLKHSERRYLEQGETASEGVAVVQDWRFKFVNRHLCEFVGMTEQELLGQPFIDVIHEDDHELLKTNHRKRLSGEPVPTRYEYRVRTRTRGLRWLEMSGSLIDWQGRPATINYINDVTARKDMEAQVHQLAFLDALTGLPNRRLLEDRLRMAVAQSGRTGLHGAVLFLDLDRFKALNDTHGHAAGDLLLVAVAQRLQALVRASDTVVRLGGDEFVVMLSPLPAQSQDAHHQAERLADKLRHALAEPYELLLPEDAGVQRVQHQGAASVGVTVFGPQDRHAEAVLQRADQAMYRAKAARGPGAAVSGSR